MSLFLSFSSGQTQKFANLFAQEILKAGFFNKSALVLALKGDLGSGKTTFTQGFIRGLGIRKKITSPTFVLFKSYKLQAKSYKLKATSHKRIYHIDCYRLRQAKELMDLGLKEILVNPQNIVLIEWPEKIIKHLPKNAVQIEFKHGEKENERIIKIKR